MDLPNPLLGLKIVLDATDFSETSEIKNLGEALKQRLNKWSCFYEIFLHLFK